MQTLTTLAPVRGRGRPGRRRRAPQAPWPWSRRWAAVAAGVRPPAVARCSSRKAAAGRQADIGGVGRRVGVTEAVEVVAVVEVR